MSASPASSRDLIVGITGATGIVFGVRALQVLRQLGIKSHLVVSRAGEMTRAHESNLSRQQLHDLADKVYPIHDVGAAIASGSFRTMGMLIAPCSVRTLAEVATGVTTTLLTRAADVVLKERRTLVMMVREAPLHAGHLRNMLAATEMGAIIHPPVPAFYTHPRSLADVVDQTLGRALDGFGLEMPNVRRWPIDLPQTASDTTRQPPPAGAAPGTLPYLALETDAEP